ncbi:MAG: FkbM family methyltransferase [Anaerolineaceae bacterium]|nr:FkbM family methyltransferase [Anaerolineaceae bacterium]
MKPKTSKLPGILEKKRIEYQPRKKVFSSYLLNKKILISDSYWYLLTLDEIWGNQIYKFHANREVPFIIDCGANIGLSVIYWKFLYPKANIIAFEPDPKILELLRKNIDAFGLDNIEIRPCAVWSSNTILCFKSDNSVGGKLVDHMNGSKLINVNTFRLRDLLNQQVDMLKIDIEGAEYEVLMDCYENLVNVDYIFIEYHGITNEPQKLHNILEMLQNKGFRYHIKEANPINHPFIRSERNKFYDLQLNIFAFKDHL